MADDDPPTTPAQTSASWVQQIVWAGQLAREGNDVILANLFAKNPFTPLKEHMAKTMECVDETQVMFDRLLAGDKEGVLESARRISTLEREADDIKQEIRGRLTSSVFMPVDRRDVLNILAHMDGVADQAEDIGVLLTMRWMELPEGLVDPLNELRKRVHTVVEASASVIHAVDHLLDVGFSGPEADRVVRLVDEVNRLEHEADKAQDVFGKGLFAHEDEMKPAALFMWVKIANKIGDLANAAERMCNQLRTMLASS